MARTKGSFGIRDKGYERSKLDLCRERIKATQLIERLQNNALAEKEFMTAGQIQSAKIALGKLVPDVASVEHKIETQQPFAYIPEQMQDVSEWQTQFTPTTKTEH